MNQGSVAQQLELDGQRYQVEQITASTWTATPATSQPGAVSQSIAMARAIEKASGCRVTDSSLAQQGTVLNAQVDCGSKLKN